MRKENNFFCVEISPCRPLERISVQQSALKGKSVEIELTQDFLTFRSQCTMRLHEVHASVANPWIFYFIF
jgi:hypothetical protein